MCGYLSIDQNQEGTLIDRGTLDASIFPPFPPARRGDFYTISAGGVIGDSDEGDGLIVEKGDVIHCISDNNGGVSVSVGNSWNSLQANTDSEGIGNGNPLFPR